MKKKFVRPWFAVATVLLALSITVQAQNYVSLWGKTAQGTAWPVKNDSTYLDGNATLGDNAIPTGWATIRGGFSDTVEATLSEAVIVRGKLELVGGGGASAYTHMRYALTFVDSVELMNQYTDSAIWVVNGTQQHFGYLFTPVTGTGTMSNTYRDIPVKNGTNWRIQDGSWLSTNNATTWVYAAVKQAPRNAVMIAGKYDFAISVQPLESGGNEVRWYLVHLDNTGKPDGKYWFGGKFIDPDQVTTKFNGICFGFNKDTETKLVNFYEVEVAKGAPIEIPEAPFDPYYVSLWGKTAQGTAWPVKNDSTYLDGDATLGDNAIPTGWATIRGGFFDPVEPTLDKAVIVRGKLELVGGGGGSAYTHMRYALTYVDSVELQYQYTDTATWVVNGTQQHFGYLFTPVTGTGTMSNTYRDIPVKNGTVWRIQNGSWLSTNNATTWVYAAVKQAPRNAEMIAGKYDFAISVQPLESGGNEVRWYLVHLDNTGKPDGKYWFGGKFIDPDQVTTKFNGICFGFNKDTETKLVNFYEVEVAKGAPIEIPEAPFDPYYVSLWGKTAQGTAWPVKNDSTYLDGDATLGDNAIPTGWATIRGGFFDPVEPTLDKAVIVRGKLELVGGGGGSAYTHMRYALTYVDSVELQYQYTDTATWVVNGTQQHFGYLFTPVTGTGTMSNTYRDIPVKNGTNWRIQNGSWLSTNNATTWVYAAVKQAPRNAEMIAGKYDFAISVQPLESGGNEVRWYLVHLDNTGKPDGKYWFGGKFVDPDQVTTKFNGICFGFNKDTETKLVNFYEVEVAKGAPIEIPEAPFDPYYVSLWGKTAQGTAWPVKNDSTYLDGDATLGDNAIPTGWATIRGGFFDPVEPTLDKAVIVRGKLELVGGGGGSAYTHMRYALTYVDSVELQYQYTDTATWVVNGTQQHFGYLFTPVTGTGTMSNTYRDIPVKNGTNWRIQNGSWLSTNNATTWVYAAVKQAPRNAVMIAGKYDFAISVQPLESGGNEVRWYLVHLDNTGKPDGKYWFGGKFVDPDQVTTKFNGICFGFNKDTETKLVNFYEVEVAKGAPIEIPEAPWEPYFVTDWGISGRQVGGWKLESGEFDGDVIAGGANAPTGLVAIRGGFDTHEPKETKALIVKGNLKLTGGGFANFESLRFGIFYSDSAGKPWQDSTLDSSWTWTGTDRAHNGYLVIPPSGSNKSTWATGTGTIGGILNGKWWSPVANSWALGSPMPDPASSSPTAGEYNFAISVRPLANGTNEIKFFLNKKDGTYYFAGAAIDDHTPVATTRFNCFGITIHNTAATQLELSEIMVDMGDPIVGIEVPESKPLPKEFVLNQNYPNPFNPSTNISFALPKAADVHLVVYNLMGQQVAELVNRKLEPGYYNINFDASNLASGIYIYRLRAGNFVSSKKFMLIK